MSDTLFTGSQEVRAPRGSHLSLETRLVEARKQPMELLMRDWKIQDNFIKSEAGRFPQWFLLSCREAAHAD